MKLGQDVKKNYFDDLTLVSACIEGLKGRPETWKETFRSEEAKC